MVRDFSINENDYDSPGYEHLRTYENMSSLYHKLVTLNYQRDFCSLYKCPPIHKYYFSIPSKNQAEQQFLFTCLCAWLIKDKCQMNLQLEPEEYEDPNVIHGVILEAVRLLIEPESEAKTTTSKEIKNAISFPSGRLKQGFGPEVVWTINILADRALELMFESESVNRSAKIVYLNKTSLDVGRNQAATSITIGQPFVGGGLTTRPLGSYQIDDASLLFDDKNENAFEHENEENNNKISIFNNILPENWYNQVERASQVLESAKLTDEGGNNENWRDYWRSASSSKESIEKFLDSSKPMMETITSRIDRHLQVINGREKFIQTNLKVPFENFLIIWRNYSSELARHGTLVEQVNLKTEKFESYNERLKNLNKQIDLRRKELNDGSQLRRLESIINQLKQESVDFDVKVGLLLTVLSKMQTKMATSSAI